MSRSPAESGSPADVEVPAVAAVAEAALAGVPGAAVAVMWQPQKNTPQQLLERKFG